MNASPLQTSSRRPSSQMRPHAVPMPSQSARTRATRRRTIRRARPSAGPATGRSRPPVGEVDDHDAAAQQARVARVALDDGGVPGVGREREPLERPGRLVQGLRGARVEVEAGELRVVPPRRARILRHDRDDQSLAVPVDLPHARPGGPTSVDLAGREVDDEQASRAGPGRRTAGSPSSVHPSPRGRTSRGRSSRGRPRAPAGDRRRLDHETASAEPWSVAASAGSPPERHRVREPGAPA